MTHLRDQMPVMYGHKKVQEKLASKLEEMYLRVQKANNLALGDFPTPDRFRAGLSAFDLNEFPALSRRMVSVAEGALSRDIPRLLVSIGEDADEQENAAAADTDDYADTASGNPFDEPLGLGKTRSKAETGNHDLVDIPWAIGPSAKRKWDGFFDSLQPVGEPPLLSGSAVRGMMLESGLPASVLKRIWNLSDCDQDGHLDREEFALACHLIKLGRAEGGNAIPEELSTAFVPPSKRH